MHGELDHQFISVLYIFYCIPSRSFYRYSTYCEGILRASGLNWLQYFKLLALWVKWLTNSMPLRNTMILRFSNLFMPVLHANRISLITRFT